MFSSVQLFSARLPLRRPRLALFLPVLAALLLPSPSRAQVTFNWVQTNLAATGLAQPLGVAVDAPGDVFIADALNNRVVELPAGGGAQTTVGTGLKNPSGVAVDSSGDVFIADTGNSRVVKLPAGGGAQTTVGTGLSGPSGVAIDLAGDVYIADTGNSRAVKVPAGGGAQTVLNITLGGMGLNFPIGIGVDAAGDVYIADTFNNRVVEVPAAGGAQTAVGTGLSKPQGVAVNAAGDVFIADDNNGRVVKVPATGGAQSVVGAAIASPVGVAVDGRGNLLVADAGSDIRVVDLQLYAVNFGEVNVCPPSSTTPAPCSKSLTLNFAITANTTLAAPKVVTLGAPNLDFAQASGSCTGAVTAPDSCTVKVTFAPEFAGARLGAVQIAGSTGSILATVPVYGVGAGPEIGFASTAQSMVGSGLSQPHGAAVDGAGDLFIADTNNNRVVEVPAGGMAQATVGTGLSAPHGVAADGAGDLLIADTGNSRVVVVPAGGGAQTVLNVTAGGVGLASPAGVAVDGAGDVFIADTSNNRVVEVPADGGPQTTVGAGLSLPQGVAADGAGNVFIADSGNSRVVKVPAGGGAQTTIGDDFSAPAGVAVDAAGDVFVADINTGRVTEDPAGGGAQILVSSKLSAPAGVALDDAGDIFVSAYFESAQLLELPRSQPPSFSFNTVGVGHTSDDSPRTVAVWNIGNQPLVLAMPKSGDNPSYPASFPEDTSGTGLCAAGASVTSGTSCDIAIDFVPTETGINSGSVTLTDNALNESAATQAILVVGSTVSEAQIITFGPIPSQTAATTLNLSASASSGLPVSFASLTPTVCTVTGATTSLISYGFCTIQATQSGSSSYLPAAPVDQEFGVAHASQTIDFGPIASQTAATTLNLSATASSGLTVSFASNTPKVCTVSGATASLIASGTCGIRASQAGNDEFFAAPAIVQKFSVHHASQTITFAPFGTQVAATTLQLSATASSGLPVSFASTTPAVCTVSGTTASLISYGFCNIKASQAGNDEYFQAQAVSRKFGVSHASQTITFAPIAGQVVGTPLTLAATASSGLAVTFTSKKPSVCTVSGTTASFIKSGTCTIQAAQAGNDVYRPAPNFDQSFNVAAQ